MRNGFRINIFPLTCCFINWTFWTRVNFISWAPNQHLWNISCIPLFIRPACPRLPLITIRYSTHSLSLLFVRSSAHCYMHVSRILAEVERDISNLCVFLSSDAQFVRVAPLSETDNPEDDKVYMFFTERAQEAEGAAGKVLYSRVARVCKVRSKFLQEKQRQHFYDCLFVFTYRKHSNICVSMIASANKEYVPDSVCMLTCGCICTRAWMFLHQNVSFLRRMTLEARGVWLTSGAPSKRLVWCVQSQDQTASIHTSTSCVSTHEHTTHMKPNHMRETPPAGLISSWSLINGCANVS